MKELKSCPFCGKNVAEITTIQECELCSNFEDDELCPNYDMTGSCGGRFVVCNANKGGCGAATGWYQTIEEAINAWNRRAK